MAREQRKTVTVLFCDIAGSTALGESVDPERLRTLLAAYFDRMKAIVEHHGGTVEKFIGDAVMAVFGVPTVHEDDALRACRAAAEMRDALPELGLEGRIGVMTGEVVTGTDERLATGDAVNVAARLEQAAPPGQILIGDPTLALARDAVDVEEVEPLTLKGKAESVVAYRLLRVRDMPERRHEAPFVGRDRELAVLTDAWDRVRSGAHCELVTVVGEAGVGKSRLAHEFAAGVRSRVVSGRCLPYGEGITYWPVVEVLKQLDLLPPEEAAAAAIRALLGESDAATSAEEIAWAFRKTLEHAAAGQPLVVVFDDTQWGEETFRDLIEHVVLLSSGAAILLLCIARPELSERHPTWPVTLRLEPLQDYDVQALIPAAIAGPLRARIARTSGGNPLFIGEMLAMTGEADGDAVVPPTLQALLAARLDQLEPAERSVLERGAVEGEVFHRGAVQALAPDDPQVTPRLAALVRKQLIQPDRPQLAGDDGFRFRHILIRDAAYDALPKAARADLHARFAAWLEERGTTVVELDEILGYHLEQACAYRAELGLPEDAELTDAARSRLAAGGRRAAVRQDFGAALNLLERAVALLTPHEIDLALELDVIRALRELGRGDDALGRAESLTGRGREQGDDVAELSGRLQEGLIRLDVEPGAGTDQLEALVDAALPELEAIGDDTALYVAQNARGWVMFTRARTDAAMEAFDRAGAHARVADIHDELVGWRALSRLYGSTPVPEVVSWLDAHEPREGRDFWLRGARATALAMLGRLAEARAMLVEMRGELADRGANVQLAVLTAIESVNVELWAGEPAIAVELAAEGCRVLEELGAEGFLSTAAAVHAHVLYDLGRLDEADDWADRSAAFGASDDMFTELEWRLTKARVLGRREDHADAERLAHEAVAIGESTDYVQGQGDAYVCLGDVLVLSAESREAVAAFEHALERYERKGSVVSAEQIRSRLAELRAAAVQ